MKIYMLMVPNNSFEDLFVIDCINIDDDVINRILDSNDTGTHTITGNMGEEIYIPCKKDMDVLKTKNENDTFVWHVGGAIWYQIAPDDYEYCNLWWYYYNRKTEIEEMLH